MRIQPKYEQVKDEIRGLINAHDSSYTTHLPSEKSLAEHFSVSRNTIRQAMAGLRKEGLIATARGGRARITPNATPKRKTSKIRLAWLAQEERETYPPVYHRILKAVQNEAFKRDVNLSLFGLDPNEGNYLTDSKGIDGVILTGVRKSRIGRECRETLEKIPFKMGVDDFDGNAVDFRICTDNYLGGRLATEHLLEIGRKNICFLGISGGFDHYTPFWERLAGYRDVLAENDINLPPEMTVISTLPCDFLDIKPKLIDLFRVNRRIDAIFVISDDLAARVSIALDSLGMRVPEDVALIGYDGLSFCDTLSPSLSTISQPMDEIGAKACSCLIDMIEKGVVEKGDCSIKPKLIIRESSMESIAKV